MPVGTIGVGASIEGTSGLGQLVAASRVVERDGTGVEVDLVGNVVPLICNKLGVPLRDTTNVPLQVGVTATAGTVLQLSEVALEEGNLVLVRRGGLVGAGCLDREMVVKLALVDGLGGLRDELRPQHSLAIPLGSLINSDLDTLLRAGVGRVLIG